MLTVFLSFLYLISAFSNYKLYASGRNLMEHHSHHEIHENKTENHHKKLHKNIMKQGVIGLIPKFSIHGAIIMSDRGENMVAVTEADLKKQQLVSARIHNVNNLLGELPFPLTEWAAVFTSACPLYPDGHKTERGLVWAHFRIMREFSYFDPVLLSKLYDAEGNKRIINETLTSRDGVYTIYTNGSLYKNDLPYLDDDIIAIFEDDAESAIQNLNVTIIEEFSSMNTDLLFTGWCEGRTARPVPLCTHAYAITRRGARKLVKFLEPCGLALDEQFVILAKNNFISWRRAYGHSYKELNEKYKGLYGEKTYGMFHQNRALGSINGHR